MYLASEITKGRILTSKWTIFTRSSFNSTVTKEVPRLQKKKCESEQSKPGVKRHLISGLGYTDEGGIFRDIIDSLDEQLGFTIRTQKDSIYLDICRREADITDEFGGPSPGARVVISDTGKCFFLVQNEE